MRIKRLVREEGGFGLVELVIAMTVLSVGLLSLFATFATGYVAVNRANINGTASVLADRTMESFRGGQYSNLAAGTTTTTYSSTSTPASPDGHTYTVTAVVNTATATNTSGLTARAEKLVTITVTDASGTTRATESSAFDALIG
jgi:Tfp pilus assembly protein PilE